MKSILITLVLFLCISCTTKDVFDSPPDSIQMNDFLNQPYSKIHQKYPSLQKEDSLSIAGKTYIAWSIIQKGQQKMQVLSDSSSGLVLEIVHFSNDSKSIKRNEYSEFYKPKCELESTIIQYDLKSKRLALVKNEKTIFQGLSLLIQDRINEDKNKKCLNRWGQ